MFRRLLAVPLLAVALLAVACEPEGTALDEAAEEGRGAALVGQQLTVSGEVTEVLTPGAFVLDGFAFGYGGEGTLVIAPEVPAIDEGGLAEVQGTVIRVRVADLESEYGLDDAEDVLVGYQEELALVADAVDFVPTGGDDEPGLDAGEEQVAGERVAYGGTVAEVLSPQVFLLHAEETDSDVVVVSPDPVAQLDAGAVAQVQGRLAVFDAAAAEEVVGAALDDPRFGELQGQPAVIADTVEVVPEG